MAKIPFDIKYRPQIESGEYKVETNDHRPVRIICWDKNTGGFDRIVALVAGGSGQEKTLHYTEEGRCVASAGNRNKDLFIVMPEEELGEFEKKLSDVVGYAISLSVAEPKKPTSEFVKEYAAELLAIARTELVKQGYIIEKKAFHDAVEKVDPEVMKEVWKNVRKDEIFERRRQTLPTSGEVEGIVKSFTDYMRGVFDGASTYAPNDMKEVLRTEYEKGRADALKDLPRWRKWGNGACGGGKYPIALVESSPGHYFLADCLGITGEKYIMLSDLEKLSGFKED